LAEAVKQEAPSIRAGQFTQATTPVDAESVITFYTGSSSLGIYWSRIEMDFRMKLLVDGR
jgi:hypothetical protein